MSIGETSPWYTVRNNKSGKCAIHLFLVKGQALHAISHTSPPDKETAHLEISNTRIVI